MHQCGSPLPMAKPGDIARLGRTDWPFVSPCRTASMVALRLGSRLAEPAEPITGTMRFIAALAYGLPFFRPKFIGDNRQCHSVLTPFLAFSCLYFTQNSLIGYSRTSARS